MFPRRTVPLVVVTLVAAAVVILVAALTTWWVLLALMPLMMIACMAMMSSMPSMMDAWRPDRWGRMMGVDGASESPTEVLDRRLAEGAISVEEYRERREVLESQSRSSSPAAP